MQYHYNRFAASSYAQQYAMHRNSDYPHFPGSDCTNFISQCLCAGGWDMLGGDRAEPLAWWAAWDMTSYAWSGADNFTNFLRISGRAYQCKPEEIDLGDIVQLVNQQGTAMHTMMVSNVLKGEYRLSYHDADELDMPISIAVGYPLTPPVYWKIMDFIPPALTDRVPGQLGAREYPGDSE